MPTDLRPPKVRRLRIKRPSKFPYIMVFILCALIVIVGTKWNAGSDPATTPSQTSGSP